MVLFILQGLFGLAAVCCLITSGAEEVRVMAYFKSEGVDSKKPDKKMGKIIRQFFLHKWQ
jgi:hypothetical protein